MCQKRKIHGKTVYAMGAKKAKRPGPFMGQGWAKKKVARKTFRNEADDVGAALIIGGLIGLVVGMIAAD